MMNTEMMASCYTDMLLGIVIDDDDAGEDDENI